MEHHQAENYHKHRHNRHSDDSQLLEFARQGLALVFAVESFLLTAESAYTTRIARLDHYDHYQKYRAKRAENKTRQTNQLLCSPTI